MEDNNIITDTQDNLLVASFFERYGKRDIADNGFSERVMGNLPRRKQSYAKRVNAVWTGICGIAAAALFLLGGGIRTTQAVVLDIMSHLASAISTIDITLSSVVIAYATMLTLCAVAVYDISASNRQAGSRLS